MRGELTVDEWFEELARGLEYRKLYGIEDFWAESEALFYNVHEGNIHAGPNLIYETGDSVMSSMSVPYPYMMVKAKRQEAIASSKLKEFVNNDLIDTLTIPEDVERAVLSSYLWGRGILKVGFDSEFGWAPEMDYGKITNTDMGFTQTQFDKNMRRIEYGKAEPGMPWIGVVLPHDFVVPWGTYDIDYGPWCAHRVVRHIDDCKGDPKYNTRGLRPVMSAKDFVESYKKQPKLYRVGTDITKGLGYAESTDHEYVELWEIHDRRTRKIYVISTGHDSFLRNEPDFLQVGGGKLPFATIGLVPRARNFWVTPDTYYLRASQHELSDISLQKQKHRRAAVLRWLFGEDAIDEDELEKLLSSDVGVAIRIKRSVADLRNAVVPLNAPPQMQLDIDAEATRRDARSLVGMSRNQFGEYEQTGRRTATEVSQVAQASNLRMDRRQAALAKLYTQLFDRINPIIEKYWTMPKVAEIAGPRGQALWQTYIGADIGGEHGCKIRFSLEPQESLEQRRQNALQMYMMLRQDPLVGPFKAAQNIAHAYNDPEFSAMFQPGVLDGTLELQLRQQQMQGQQGMGMGGNQAGTGEAPKKRSQSGKAGTAKNGYGTVSTP